MDSLQLVGVSPAIAEVREEIAWAARTDAKVLISGESGVGKEVVARLIHQASLRSRLPLVTINCAGVPDNLLASEMFGHVRGSFTSAHRDTAGWLQQAHRGTIFMDEIGEMSAQMQTLLLRFLENGEVQRVGASELGTARVDVRVIAATNRRLLDRVNAGEFRADLYYRLNVIHFEIPPLRARREDIPVLWQHFVGTFAERHRIPPPRCTPSLMSRLTAYEWPGNVRQLRNLVERVVVRSDGGELTEHDLPPEFERSVAPAAPVVPSLSRARELFDRMATDGEGFWSVVHPAFMARDLTRDELREIVRSGLTTTRGSYKGLVRLFNMPDQDYKRFLTFLHKHRTHFSVHEFRMIRPRVEERAELVAV
jgi:DNA-binding NtrC family response regulator